MSWQKRKRLEGFNKSYSLINRLRKEGKSNEEFELFLNNLTLEEVIGLKLDLSAVGLMDGKMYGFPIWKMLPDIVKEAVLSYAVSATKSRVEAARLLGVKETKLYGLLKQYHLDSYFMKEINTDGL